MARKTSPVRQTQCQAASCSTTSPDTIGNSLRRTRSSAQKKPAAVPKPAVNKTQSVIGLLKRKTGVSIEELQEITGWQAHSIRGLLSGALPKRHRLNIVSHIDGNGTRRYRIKAEGK